MGQVLSKIKMAEIFIRRFVRMKLVEILDFKALLQAQLTRNLYIKFYKFKG